MPNLNGGLYSAILMVFIASPAFGATDAMCDLIVKMQDVFKILRTLAFVGAGFLLAKYAWEVITTGKIGGKDLLEGLKNTGISLIFGFILLFSIGVVLGFLSNGANLGCPEITTGW